jgi:acyl CoA:acetate/3-ketoacid CoA transferase alpha subunit
LAGSGGGGGGHGAAEDAVDEPIRGDVKDLVGVEQAHLDLGAGPAGAVVLIRKALKKG